MKSKLIAKNGHAALSKGFSLVELMISLALGSIVSAGVVQLFVANSETQSLLIGQSRMQESARFSLAFIAREVRQAGYRGCYSGTDALNSTILPESNLPYEFDLRTGLRGYEATAADTWDPSLAELPNTDADLAMDNVLNTVFKTTYDYGAGNGIDLDTVVSGTDVVTFRHISQVDARLGGFMNFGSTVYFDDTTLVMPSTAEDLVVGIEDGWDEFDLDHIAMIHDCQKATMFRVTSANPWGRNTDKSPKAKTGNGDLTVTHDIADIDSTKNSLSQLAAGVSFSDDASVSAIVTSIFFIAPGAGTNNAGNNPLSLWKKEGLNAPIELVEGVENLQILYGVDSNSDGVPNQYVAANFVAGFDIITIRVTIVVNSIDDVGSTSLPSHGCAIQDCVTDEAYDGLLRRSFSQTIMLRNRA
ncbi:MAG: type IV pilus assembly protein PilW [Candidatus Azotimanducaceae bacterium]|jgi:type IV pilus assembly protein PilW